MRINIIDNSEEVFHFNKKELWDTATTGFAILVALAWCYFFFTQVV